ncbi:MAG: DUF3343 domain-containing protein [Ruminococcaceae bacterium]|nr:DUF3343 domain-containing protein [Oscillospiraceae bacterium]
MIVITFFTHHSAQMTYKTLRSNSISSKMAPVPRELSSSCGSCVVADVDEIDLKFLDEDYEAVYKLSGKSYIKISSNE